MIGISITVNTKNATNAIDKFISKNVGMRIAKEANRQLVENMKSLVPIWNSNLHDSIQGYQTKNGYVIRMNFYGRFVEKGHRITTVTPLLRNWAYTATEPLRDPEGFLSAITFMNKLGMSYKAKEHPFIQPSIDMLQANLDSTSINIVNKTLKESGFK